MRHRRVLPVYDARQGLDAAAREVGCKLDPVSVTGSLERQKELARRERPFWCCR